MRLDSSLNILRLVRFPNALKGNALLLSRIRREITVELSLSSNMNEIFEHDLRL